ncbi:MAG: hypothetical protein KJ648_07345 [Candidatus Omnitrophica bacterium]|nr:hypothetical protein [Candidatus Omnitrophota bacterium]
MKWPCRKGLRRGLKLTPSDVDQAQLRMGIRVEKEHTTSPRMACRIALDHLAEHKRYYTRLRKARL